jgi:hypothetical protein
MAEQSRKMFDQDEVAAVLQGGFYVPQDEAPPSGLRAKTAAPDKDALHYKVICISLYNEDLQRLDGMVDTLKGKGFTKASRSALIRAALDQVDLSKIRRGM